MAKIFGQLYKYRENNRIEAKKATGGLPRSIWETYSAFANTGGGVILLGVAEDKKDRRLYPVDLPDPQRLIAQFLEAIDDTRIVNRNLLKPSNVAVEKVDGKEIVVIRVPRATRKQKPIYIGGNPLTGTYYRNGDGDYKCSEAEVREMLEKAQKE
ncbi:MAG: ATP-binding protein [Clostridia bacterium]|nr:ATP-binding protein [Clostridia bacterium]